MKGKYHKGEQMFKKILSLVLLLLITGVAFAKVETDSPVAGSQVIYVTSSGSPVAVAGDASGNVSISTSTVAVTSAPTISTSAYAAGDNIGGLISLASAVRVSGGSGVINTVVVADKALQNSALDVVFFAANPTNTTFTDNAALTVHDTDLLTIVGHISVAASDYTSFADNSVATSKNNGLAFKLTSGTTLYAAIVCRGTPTYAATSDIKLIVKIFQD